MKIYKAYDIRGIYPTQINEDNAYKIGLAYAAYTKVKDVVMGYDARPHSIPLFKAFSKALLSQGINIINIGLCSSPICYFANGSLKVDGSVMVTASHNGTEWNGFKMCINDAQPLSYKKGIREIEELVINKRLPAPKAIQGKVTKQAMGMAYAEKTATYIAFKKKPKIVIDYANSVGVKEMEYLTQYFHIIPLYDELDGTFPNHDANPLQTDTLKDLQKAVIEHNADFGAAFDGDADRCGFIDEKGSIIGMDLTTALIAENLIKQKGPQTILYDLRSSKAVPEAIQKVGGIAEMTGVGHAVIKETMRARKAAFAGELSGHYYFKENYYSESQALVIILLCNILEEKDCTLSELTEPLKIYKNTGEINLKVHDITKVLEKLKHHYKDAHLFELDGVSLEYDTWWANVRPSNTEPLLRVFIEADSSSILADKKKELLEIIQQT